MDLYHSRHTTKNPHLPTGVGLMWVGLLAQGVL
jgi:hypothetical protein